MSKVNRIIFVLYQDAVCNCAFDCTFSVKSMRKLHMSASIPLA